MRLTPLALLALLAAPALAQPAPVTSATVDLAAGGALRHLYVESNSAAHTTRTGRRRRV